MTGTPTAHWMPSENARVLALTTLMAAIAAAMYAGWLHGATPVDAGSPTAVLALPLIFAVAEMCVIHVHFRTEATSFSLSEIGLVLGLVYASPSQLVAAHVAGG